MTLQEVARRARVSTATVSRVLNNPDSVKSTTRARVLKIVQELKYSPNLHARGLANGEGRPFTPTMVQRVIRTYQLTSRRQRLLDAGLIPLSQMAQLLGVSTGTVTETVKASAGN